MRTERDYWLENVPFEIALKYIEGDIKKVREDRDVNYHREDAFSSYGWGSATPKTFTRIGRKEADGAFFLVPPKMAVALQVGEITPPDLSDLAEPDVVRIELEHLPAGGVMMTYLDPLTKTQHSSGEGLRKAMPWLFSKHLENVLGNGYIYALGEAEQNAIRDRLQGYADAIMLKYFTVDLNYSLETTLLDVANARLDFQAKLDLLRGEFLQYRAMGLPHTLVKELLPSK